MLAFAPLRWSTFGCLLCLASLPAAPAPTAWIGDHHCTVFNALSPQVIVIFHGYLSDVANYYPLGNKFAEAGYAVVIPHDCDGVSALTCAATWGKDVAAEVRNWAVGRPVAVVGHSLGGGAVMAAAKFTPGLDAFIAMHPAPVLSGASWSPVKGPILFTTGTADDGTFGGNAIGATSPNVARNAYNDALLPKALVNVKGNKHWSSVMLQGDEEKAVMNWLGCFLRKHMAQCEWVRNEMCKSTNLEWCYHWGLQEATWKMEGVQAPIHV